MTSTFFLSFGYEGGNTFEREARDDLGQVDGQYAHVVVGVRTIEHEEVGKSWQHGAQIGARPILGPEFFDLDASAPRTSIGHR